MSCCLGGLIRVFVVTLLCYFNNGVPGIAPSCSQTQSRIQIERSSLASSLSFCDGYINAFGTLFCWSSVINPVDIFGTCRSINALAPLLTRDVIVARITMPSASLHVALVLVTPHISKSRRWLVAPDFWRWTQLVVRKVTRPPFSQW